jgi:RNA polymerase sigma factor (sigma-70 family)
VAALPDTGRATEVERPLAPEAEVARELYERHSAAIFRFCLQRLGSREEAEDAVQSTFLNAFRGLGRGVRPQAEAAWLFKIAENVCLTRRRSFSRRRRVELTSDLEAVQDRAAAPARAGEDELIPLPEALAGLPETQRRAILLREWKGLSYREIGVELGLSQPAVETLLFRARRSLAKGLEAPGKLRVRYAGQLGSALTALKALLGGGSVAALKLGLVIAAAVGGGVALATTTPSASVHHRRAQATPEASVATETTRLPRPNQPAAAAAPDEGVSAARAGAPPRHRSEAQGRARPARAPEEPLGGVSAPRPSPATESARSSAQSAPTSAGKSAQAPRRVGLTKPAPPRGRAVGQNPAAHPDHPAKPEHPAKPPESSTPETPAAPGKPEKPEKPEAASPPQPPQSEQPEQPQAGEDHGNDGDHGGGNGNGGGEGKKG